METEERIQHALEQTEILKPPQRLISTNKPSTLHYFVLTEPAYLEVLEDEGPETRIREGKVRWEQPRLLTPSYIMRMEGFSEEARKALRIMARQNPDMAGLLYKMKYKKEAENTVTLSSGIGETCEKIKAQLDDDAESEDLPLTAIIRGVDELWDVSLMKFIQDFLLRSAYYSQLPDFQSQGLIQMDHKTGYPQLSKTAGVPVAARREIEHMFRQAKNGEIEPEELKEELDRWGVFAEYENRFLDLFKR